MWKSLFEMIRFFHETAINIASYLDYNYSKSEFDEVISFLQEHY